MGKILAFRVSRVVHAESATTLVQCPSDGQRPTDFDVAKEQSRVAQVVGTNYRGLVRILAKCETFHPAAQHTSPVNAGAVAEGEALGAGGTRADTIDTGPRITGAVHTGA